MYSVKEVVEGLKIWGQAKIQGRGVSGYLELGGQVVMWRAAAAGPTSGGAFYSAKNWVGNCPPCPPASLGPGWGFGRGGR